MLRLSEEGKIVFSGQVLKVGEPLPDLSEDQIVWSNSVEIHKIAKNGTVDYKVVFAHPPKVNDPIDDVLRTRVDNVVSKLPR
jgi:hypothetical protein